MAGKKNGGPARKSADKIVESTPVRNSPVPKVSGKKPALAEITHGMIAERAYAIWQSGCGGCETEHWTRAEEELRGL